MFKYLKKTLTVLKARMFGIKVVGFDPADGKDYGCNATGYLYRGVYYITDIEVYRVKEKCVVAMKKEDTEGLPLVPGGD